MPERRIPNLGLQQAYALRNLAVAQALQLEPEQTITLDAKAMKARALRDLTMTWDRCCDRIRIIKKQPLPGQLKARSLKPRTRNFGIANGQSFTEE